VVISGWPRYSVRHLHSGWAQNTGISWDCATSVSSSLTALVPSTPYKTLLYTPTHTQSIPCESPRETSHRLKERPIAWLFFPVPALEIQLYWKSPNPICVSWTQWGHWLLCHASLILLMWSGECYQVKGQRELGAYVACFFLLAITAGAYILPAFVVIRQKGNSDTNYSIHNRCRSPHFSLLFLFLIRNFTPLVISFIIHI
jgi:hypothetical protein